MLSTSSSGSFTEREVVHVGRGVFGLGRVSVAIILILKLKSKRAVRWALEYPVYNKYLSAFPGFSPT